MISKDIAHIIAKYTVPNAWKLEYNVTSSPYIKVSRFILADTQEEALSKLLYKYQSHSLFTINRYYSENICFTR